MPPLSVFYNHIVPCRMYNRYFFLYGASQRFPNPMGNLAPKADSNKHISGQDVVTTSCQSKIKSRKQNKLCRCKLEGGGYNRALCRLQLLIALRKAD